MSRRYLLVTAVFVVLIAGCGKNSGGGQQANTPTESKEAKKWMREDFRKEAVGKTPDQMISKFGKPHDTTDHGERQTWYYRQLTVDPVTNKTDFSITVRFKDGKVYEVIF